MLGCGAGAPRSRLVLGRGTTLPRWGRAFRLGGPPAAAGRGGADSVGVGGVASLRAEGAARVRADRGQKCSVSASCERLRVHVTSRQPANGGRLRVPTRRPLHVSVCSAHGTVTLSARIAIIRLHGSTPDRQRRRGCVRVISRARDDGRRGWCTPDGTRAPPPPRERRTSLCR